MNLRPIGYTYPNISEGSGLFHHPQTADLFICFLVQDVGRCEIYWLGSSSLVSAPFRLLVETL
ncbi:MAG: hypothetical protein ACRC62_31190, partial [Microcoleus sp.]